MSNFSNEWLLERAIFVQQVYEGTIVDTTINELIKNNELDQLELVVSQYEADIARDELYGYGIVIETEATDVY